MAIAHPAVAVAEAVLAIHLAVIGFNVFGLVVIPLGAGLGWRFVRLRAWRWLHLASMAVVAVQALAGRACLLTILQADLSGEGSPQPLVMRVVSRLVFWPLPMWAFTALYVALLAYVVLLMKLVPPTRSNRS